MTADRGLLAKLEARPGKGGELAGFLKQGRELTGTGTVTWYAFKVSDTAYGLFDMSEAEGVRPAHLNGQIPAAFAEAGPDLLASDPDIRTAYALAVK